MKKNNINLTDFKIKSIGNKLPKNVLKMKNILLKQIEKLHIECEEQLEKETNIIRIPSIIDKYKKLAKPLIDCIVKIIENEEQFIILERKE